MIATAPTTVAAPHIVPAGCTNCAAEHPFRFIHARASTLIRLAIRWPQTGRRSALAADSG